jgi:hypothetical protein
MTDMDKPERSLVVVGFKKLEEHGYSSGYMQSQLSDCGNYVIWSPTFSLDWCKENFPGKGDKVRFMNQNGYDTEREKALKAIGLERIVTVVHCDIGSSSSSYTFEEVPGKWNTVMFDKI